MDTFIPKDRAVNFSKFEKDRFQSLIEKYKEIIFCKKTDNISNIKKNRAWAAIHAEFNAGGEHPRTLRQLKAKLDNLKRHARKDASQERQARIRTGGGSPALPIKQETEWLRTVMPVSMDGLPSVVDDDFIENSSSTTSSYHLFYLQIIDTVSDTDMLADNVFDSKSPASLLRTPVSKSLRIRKRLQNNSEAKRCEGLKYAILTKTQEYEEHLYKLKVKHYEETRKEAREIYELQKKKLILEIRLLENKLEDN